MTTQEQPDAASLNACVVGATGGIGAALVEQLHARATIGKIYALSRQPAPPVGTRIVTGTLDLLDESSIADAARAISEPLDLVLVATGILHGDGGLSPEKTYRALDGAHLAQVLAINTTGPALVAKHFLPLLRPKSRSVFAALSARVGSIGDNRLGGWYSYRASKAALNMILRSLAIETARRHRDAVIVGLHPGTVDTGLSQPFQGNVPPGKLFSPDFCAQRLLGVIDGLGPDDSGKVWDWDGKRVPE
jgi:NAD(P)-dependent dehydrogenase (short-subunit alcohol dehydrogenase family)